MIKKRVITEREGIGQNKWGEPLNSLGDLYFKKNILRLAKLTSLEKTCFAWQNLLRCCCIYFGGLANQQCKRGRNVQSVRRSTLIKFYALIYCVFLFLGWRGELPSSDKFLI